jgi:phospholipid/cholesterol/gamma-HCH transport system permease protein
MAIAENSPLPDAPAATSEVQRPPSAIRGFFREAGDLASFAASAVGSLRGAPANISEVMRQTAILVVGSTLIIAFLELLISASLIDFAFYFLRAISATDYTGLVSGIIIPRGTTPLMFGYVFAAKVGCGIVSEIGAMKINEEIAGYEAEAVDPMRYVVGTRLAATILYMPIAVPVALLAASAGGYLSAVVILKGLSSAAFLRYHWGVQAVSDQLLTLGCITVTAVTIVIVSSFYGMRARGGPASVGAASARSLVVNLVLIHLIVPGYLALCYGADAHLPIGG